MKLKQFTLAVAIALTAGPVMAGDFTTLPNTGAALSGSLNQNFNRFYITATNMTFEAEGIPSLIAYNATSTTSPFPVTGTGTLTLLDYSVTQDFELNGEELGDIYDFVFRDSRDNTLVFGTRVRLGVEPDHSQDGEINFVFRRGFQEGTTTFDTSVAWTFVEEDYRISSAARTSSDSLTGATTFDPTTVRIQTDVNVTEGAPNSGLYLVKTNAMYYTVADGAIGVFQAGEEGQDRIGADFAGFIPTNTAPVPEPSTYAMLLGGLGLLGAMARRRRNV